jgi:hypothetical protein
VKKPSSTEAVQPFGNLFQGSLSDSGPTSANMNVPPINIVAPLPAKPSRTASANPMTPAHPMEPLVKESGAGTGREGVKIQPPFGSAPKQAEAAEKRESSLSNEPDDKGFKAQFKGMKKYKQMLGEDISKS